MKVIAAVLFLLPVLAWANWDDHLNRQHSSPVLSVETVDALPAKNLVVKCKVDDPNARFVHLYVEALGPNRANIYVEQNPAMRKYDGMFSQYLIYRNAPAQITDRNVSVQTWLEIPGDAVEVSLEVQRGSTQRAVIYKGSSDEYAEGAMQGTCTGF